MKKISYILAMLGMAACLSSCETDRDPVFHSTTSETFQLNTPALADQYLELSADGTFEITCKSQPDYGMPIAPITYGVEVSITGDFNDAVKGDDGTVVTPATYREIKANTSTSVMTISSKKLTQAICALKGYTEDEDEATADLSVMKVYFRGVCYPGTPDEEFNTANRVVSSNIVTLNQVKPYFSLAKPGFIYLIGQPAVGSPVGDWFPPMADNADLYENWKLYEKDDQIESKIYYGVFDIPAECALFRFYTALTGWDADSYGSQADDSPLVCNWEDKDFGLVKGKGAYNFSSWPGGTMYVRVNMKDMTVTISNTEIKDE